MSEIFTPPLTVNFATEREAGYHKIYQRQPLITSTAANWQDLCVAYDWYPPGRTPKLICSQHSVGIFTDLPAPVMAERIIDGKLRREQVNQGDCIIIPAHASQQAEWNLAGGAVTLAIEPALFAQTIYEVVDPDTVELLPQFATPDPLIHQLGRALKTALANRGSGNRLYAESLVNALILHLLEHYSATRIKIPEAMPSQLPQYKLQQVIGYIDAYLERDLSLKELSALVKMSPHYFSQLFKRAQGMTPHQYVIHCRVARAKNLIRHSKLSLAEIAIQVGFVDQSHLHRHFKRLVGLTPKQYRQA